MDNSKIFIIEDGEMGYEDTFKLRHSVKAMFSLSSSHKANNETRKNLIRYGNLEYFNEKPKAGYNNFTSKYKSVESCYDRLLTDVNYVIYLYEHGDIVFTNLVRRVNGDRHFAIGEKALALLIETYYSGDEMSFLLDIDMMIEGKKIIEHKNASIKFRKMMETRMIAMIENKKPRQVLLTASHNDHGMLHIHRIYRNPNN